MKDELELWCERGIPRTEIIARVGERSDADCLIALKSFERAGDGREADKNAILGIVEEMAARLCDTAKIMAFFDIHYSKQFAKAPPDKAAIIYELHTLLVEYHVRAAKASKSQQN
jgi:hypothetical protein